jgi:deoxycytidylate deaminase
MDTSGASPALEDYSGNAARKRRMNLQSKNSLPVATMRQAQQWAQLRSKDPSSKVGAVLYDPYTGGLFMGYNGFPKGIEDRPEWWNSRPTQEEMPGLEHLCKYDLVVHAEVNAVNKALKAGVDMANSNLFCTHMPCPICMKDVVLLNGIKQIFYITSEYKSMTPRALRVVRGLALLGGVQLYKVHDNDTITQDPWYRS